MSVGSGVLWSVCLHVCLFVCPRAYLWNRWTDLHKILVQIPCGRGLVLRRRCDTLCTFGFMDDVTFGHNGLYGIAWPAWVATSHQLHAWQSVVSMNGCFCFCAAGPAVGLIYLCRCFSIPSVLITLLVTSLLLVFFSINTWVDSVDILDTGQCVNFASLLYQFHHPHYCWVVLTHFLVLVLLPVYSTKVTVFWSHNDLTSSTPAVPNCCCKGFSAILV